MNFMHDPSDNATSSPMLRLIETLPGRETHNVCWAACRAADLIGLALL